MDLSSLSTAEIIARHGKLINATTPLETLLTSADYFGLTTATPLQRAICRVTDGKGLGELARHASVLDGIGPVPEGLGRPRELVILSGIRTGKSLFTAALAVHWTQVADIRHLTVGEVARVSVLSLTVDLARVVFGHIVGNCLAKPTLKKLVIGEPTADSIFLRHPSGRPVEIKVVAGARAGASLVARWSAGLILDEAPRMIGADEGVVNYDDARSAVIGRLLPGAQLVSIGSPWIPVGPIYDAVQECWKQPTPEKVVIWAPGWVMNPIFWTPERVEHLKQTEPDIFVTDCMAQFASAEESLFNSLDLDKSTRSSPAELPWDPAQEYVAAMDPATRSNAWTLIIATRIGNKRIIVLARQWLGSKLEPLNAVDVMSEIAKICKSYNVKGVMSDQYFGDALHAIARERGFSVIQKHLTEVEKAQKSMSLRTRLNEGAIELPPIPELRTDMQRVKRITTQTGIKVKEPRTSDGRHCDFFSSILLALLPWLDDVKSAPPEPGSDEATRLEVAAMRKASQEKYTPEVNSRGRIRRRY